MSSPRPAPWKLYTEEARDIQVDIVPSLVEALRDIPDASTPYKLILENADDAQVMCIISLVHNTAIAELRLENGRFGPTGLKNLGQALSANKTIKTLSLSKNPYGAQGINALCDHIARASAEHLHLDGVELEDKGMKVLVEALDEMTHLKYLNLANNRFTINGVHDLAKLLRSRTCRLEALDLSGNVLGSNGIAALGGAMQADNSFAGREYAVPMSITSLDLSCTSLGDQGLRALCVSMTQAARVPWADPEGSGAPLLQCPFRRLVLRGNGITDQGIGFLLPLLEEPGKFPLEELDLSDNLIREPAVSRIFSAVAQNPCLRVLDLSGSLWGPPELLDLAACVSANQGLLEHVGLRPAPDVEASLHDAGVAEDMERALDRLAQAAPYHAHLQDVDLGFIWDAFGDAVAVAMLKDTFRAKAYDQQLEMKRRGAEDQRTHAAPKPPPQERSRSPPGSPRRGGRHTRPQPQSDHQGGPGSLAHQQQDPQAAIQEFETARGQQTDAVSKVCQELNQLLEHVTPNGQEARQTQDLPPELPVPAPSPGPRSPQRASPNPAQAPRSPPRMSPRHASRNDTPLGPGPTWEQVQGIVAEAAAQAVEAARAEWAKEVRGWLTQFRDESEQHLQKEGLRMDVRMQQLAEKLMQEVRWVDEQTIKTQFENQARAIDVEQQLLQRMEGLGAQLQHLCQRVDVLEHGDEGAPNGRGIQPAGGLPARVTKLEHRLNVWDPRKQEETLAKVMAELEARMTKRAEEQAKEDHEALEQGIKRCTPNTETTLLEAHCRNLEQRLTQLEKSMVSEQQTSLEVLESILASARNGGARMGHLS